MRKEWKNNEGYLIITVIIKRTITKKLTEIGATIYERLKKLN